LGIEYRTDNDVQADNLVLSTIPTVKYKPEKETDNTTLSEKCQRATGGLAQRRQ
jgi:hypothetical protein